MVNLRFWRKSEEQLTEQDHFYASGLFSSENQKTQSEIDQNRDMGTNLHMITDDGLLTQIEQFCKYQVEVPKVEMIPDGKGGFVPHVTMETKDMVDWNMIALRALCTNVLCTRWIDPRDADYYKESLEYELEELKEQMSHSEYQRKAALFDAVKPILLTAIDDAVNGRKARLLKVQIKGFEVDVRHQQPGKGNVVNQ